MNLVVFDFCETLVDFQTADNFCRFVLLKKKKKLYLKLDSFFEEYKVYNFLTLFKLFNNLQKKILLKGLKGLSSFEIDSFAKDYLETVIENKKNKIVFDKFIEHIKLGDYVVINSGGYEPYLHLFSLKYSVKKTFATKFKYERNFFTGEIDGEDCLQNEKVLRMEKDGVLSEKFVSIFVYSDSITDMPLFNIATRKFAVLRGSFIPQWCLNRDFEIIRL
jgi:phosphatidylglycerophosphatase C